MLLRGSCHCGAVRFSVHSPHPYPYNLCYCSICRKTAGGGGYAINLGADAESLEITGREYLKVYQARLHSSSGETTVSPGHRNFCAECGSALWLWDPRWPDLIHPHASAIDTPLPVPPERTHIMLGSKANWVPVHAEENDRTFEEYPDESLAEWHRRLNLEDG